MQKNLIKNSYFCKRTVSFERKKWVFWFLQKKNRIKNTYFWKRMVSSESKKWAEFFDVKSMEIEWTFLPAKFVWKKKLLLSELKFFFGEHVFQIFAIDAWSTEKFHWIFQTMRMKLSKNMNFRIFFQFCNKNSFSKCPKIHPFKTIFYA